LLLSQKLGSPFRRDSFKHLGAFILLQLQSSYIVKIALIICFSSYLTLFGNLKSPLKAWALTSAVAPLRIHCGDRSFDLTFVLRICKILGLSLAELVKGKTLRNILFVIEHGCIAETLIGNFLAFSWPCVVGKHFVSGLTTWCSGKTLFGYKSAATGTGL
jgi:hypothetical protein